MNTDQSNGLRGFLSKHAAKLWLLQAICLLSFGLIFGFAIAWVIRGTNSLSNEVPEAHLNHSESSQIWTCSMHPQIRRDKPGKCPLCGMNLVPVTASSGGMRTITISPTARKLMDIETTPVQRKVVDAEVRMVGKIEYDETRLSHITAWVSGRLDRLYVDYTGIEVKKNDHLVYIYSEQLYSAQEELIQALKNQRQRPPTTTLIQPIDLVESAREKLRLLGVTDKQVKEIEARGTPDDHFVVYSPIGGVVIDKLRQEGDRVRTGDRIYTVADLKHVWVKLDAYESDHAWLHYGQAVEFSVEAYPGEVFRGRIAFIDRVLDEGTRTAKVRVNVANDDGRLKPGMFVRAVVRSRIASGGSVLDSGLAGKWISPMHPEIVKDEPGLCDICEMPLVRAETLGFVVPSQSDSEKPLVIPTSAALVTGTRAIVFVELPTAKEPTFNGREIVLGPRAGGYYLVRSGLKEGELVVTNGNFKLDSALQISAKPSMMTPEGGGGGGHNHGGGSQSPNATHDSHGMSLPAAFRSQLEGVINSFDKLTVAVEGAELKKINVAFDSLGTDLAQVDSDMVSGHAKVVWQEFNMLLTNDAVEGREARLLVDVDRVYLETKRHIQRMREAFGMGDVEAKPQMVRLKVPLDFLKQLEPVTDIYFAIQDALAADDAERALQSAQSLRSVLEGIRTDTLDQGSSEFWANESVDLSKIADEFGKAEGIKSLRETFALFSDEMLVVVKSFGLESTRPVYQLHCPMAFKGRGATWLQMDSQTKNPYFGATMLKCADQVKLLKHDDMPNPSHHDGHGKHQH